MISLEYVRPFRMGPFAIFDTVTAFLGILILSPLLTWLAAQLHLKISTRAWLWFTLPLAVIFHVIFQQSTPLMKILSNPGHVEFYIAISILVAMTYMGLRKIKKGMV